MYNSNYNVEQSSKKITQDNRATAVSSWFADGEYKLDDDERKHLKWCAKWILIGFIVASALTYLVKL